MRTSILALLLLPGLSAAHLLSAKRLAHSLVLSSVYINGQGPLRLFLDTGAESCSLRPEVAARIGLPAQYQVEQVTVAGEGLRPAARAELRVRTVLAQDVEFLLSPIPLAGVDGVLGQSWLGRHAYLLDYRNERLVLDGDPPEGVRVPLFQEDGRPALEAEVDGEYRRLVLDSGAAALFIYRPAPRFSARVQVQTNQGTREAGIGRAYVRIGDYRSALRTVELPGRQVTGLLPASAFPAIYVARRDGVVVLVRRQADPGDHASARRQRGTSRTVVSNAKGIVCQSGKPNPSGMLPKRTENGAGKWPSEAAQPNASRCSSQRCPI